MGGFGGSHGKEKEIFSCPVKRTIRSNNTKKLWADPEFRNKIMNSKSGKKLSILETEELYMKIKMKNDNKTTFNSPEYKMKMSAACKKAWSDETLKENTSLRSTNMWADKDFKNKMIEKKKIYMNTDEYKSKMRIRCAQAAKDKKEKRNNELKILVLESDIDFTIPGWKEKVQSIIKTSKVYGWMKENMSETFYNKCYFRFPNLVK